MKNKSYAIFTALVVLVVGSVLLGIGALVVLAASRPAGGQPMRNMQTTETDAAEGGAALLFLSSPYDAKRQFTTYRLTRLDIATGVSAPLEGLPEGNHLDMKLSPDQSKISFVTSTALFGLNDGDLYVMNADGSDLRNLTPNDPQGVMGASWSPDSMRIAYITGAIGALSVVDLATGSSTLLADNAASAQWSPDGTQLVYWGFNTASSLESDIFVIAADGSSAARNITNQPADANRDVDWTPDGRVIFTSLRSGNWDIYTVNPDGSDLRNLTPDTPAANERYAFSPDGTWLAFTSLSMADQGERNIWLMRANGGAPQMISDHPDHGQADYPTWSPDGSQLAFSWMVDGKWNLHVYDLATGAVRNLAAEIGLEGSIAWSPDGTQIAFMGKVNDGTGFYDAELYLVPADGSAPPRNLTNNPGAYDMLPQWVP